MVFLVTPANHFCRHVISASVSNGSVWIVTRINFLARVKNYMCHVYIKLGLVYLYFVILFTWTYLNLISFTLFVQTRFFKTKYVVWKETLIFANNFTKYIIIITNVFLKHGWPRWQQSQNLSPIFWPRTIPGTYDAGTYDVSEVWATNRWTYSPSPPKL